MKNQAKKFALIGENVEKSLSPRLHQYFAQQHDISLRYEAISCKPGNFEALIHDLIQQNYAGVNVTAPFKIEAFRLAQSFSQAAILCQAANVLRFRDNQIFAANTDLSAIEYDFKRHQIPVCGKNVLLLGVGGAAKAVLSFLEKMQPEQVYLWNRSEANLEKLIQEWQEKLPLIKFDLTKDFQKMDVMINSTSVDTLKLLPENIQHIDYFYTLNYGENACQLCEELNHQGMMNVFTGIGMLIDQAALTFEIWFGFKPNFSMSQLINTLLLP